MSGPTQRHMTKRLRRSEYLVQFRVRRFDHLSITLTLFLGEGYRLQNEIKEFERYILPTPEEWAVREWLVNRVTDVVTSIWPSAKVRPFGSYCTGLSLPTRWIFWVWFRWRELLWFWICFNQFDLLSIMFM